MPETLGRERKRQLETIRKETFEWAIKRYRSDDLSEEDRRKALGSQYCRLLEDVSISAKEYAEQSDVNGDEFETLLETGFSVVDDLKSSLTPFTNTEEEELDQLRFWTHEQFPERKLLSGDTPYIIRGSLESVVDDYLALPFRNRAIERLLVDALIAVEMFGFSDEVWGKGAKILGNLSHSPFQQPNALIWYLRFIVVCAIVLLGPAAVLASGTFDAYVSRTWSLPIAGVLAAIFGVLFLLSVIEAPRALKSQEQARKKYMDLGIAMATVYRELDSTGPISARHVLHMLNDSTRQGVSWPAPLFALLDDICVNTGRF